jgi:hypothetical protein
MIAKSGHCIEKAKHVSASAWPRELDLLQQLLWLQPQATENRSRMGGNFRHGLDLRQDNGQVDDGRGCSASANAAIAIVGICLSTALAPHWAELE